MNTVVAIFYKWPKPKDVEKSYYRYEIPKGQSVDEEIAAIIKCHPRCHRVVIKVYNNPYENWDMTNEHLNWVQCFHVPFCKRLVVQTRRVK